MNVDDELLPTRQSLLSRLKDWNDQESWKAFFETYWKLIYHCALKAGLSDAEAQDVVQETVLSVCKSMKSFKYRAEGGSFKAWLLQLTEWRISDQFRRRQRQTVPLPESPGSTAGAEGAQWLPDPARSALEAAWDEEWQRNLMDAAIERVKRRVDAKQYQVFDLYVLKKWPVKKIAATLKLHATQVYLAKHRISALIRRELRGLEAKPV